MSIYTKRGDKGETDLLNNVRASKDELKIAVIGTIDELNSLLGVIRSDCQLTDVAESIAFLQKSLFTLGAYFAGMSNAELPRPQVLESVIDDLETFIPKLTSFILPGGHKVASLLHHARSVCRRAERMVVALHKKEKVDAEVLIYINRMSDFLFILARYVNHFYMIQEIEWEGVSSVSAKSEINEAQAQEVSLPPMEISHTA